ncbi:alkene reductase [Neptunitalea chrysea]|uniref:Alkene reductase n=1 Tax=Neptunitalea chrysea TaxID=1647581 RepID=A0A9W6B6W1_9FLAO|nr:alkene reductase [Neptunitalea chrysea]GLB53971.1 alkene reductase [Neptunitalea chrysea]
MTVLNKYITKSLTLKNRVVMAPMTRSRADNEQALATNLIAEYYEQRATAGLLITEGINVSKRSVGYINVPGIYTEEQKMSWKNVTQKVHQKEGKIFAQLWHVGRISHPDLINGKLPLAPSAINPNSQCYTPEGFKDTEMPKEMSVKEIQDTISDFQKAAENAIKADFDGIEIHAANGYLFHQFFAKCANIRTDKYGGSIENRARILFDTLDAIRQKIPISKVGVRLSPDFRTWFGMKTDDETEKIFEYIITKLNDYDLAYLHIGGYVEADDETPTQSIINTAKHYRKFYKGTYMINRAFTKELANDAIENNITDLVSFGEPFISNPDLVKRFELNASLQKADQNTFYTTGEKGYTDYPFLEI